MGKSRKVLRSLAVIGVLAALAGVGAFSVFSDFTDNENNQVTAGTVVIDDNDGGTALYNFTNAKPGQSAAAKCIRVDYTGTLPADVKLYRPTSTPLNAFASNVNLKVEGGTQTTFNSNCSGFTAQQTLFDAALDTFPSSYAGGVSDYPGSETSWDNGESVVYRVTASLSASTPDSAQGGATGLHTIRWEAQNQP